MKQLFTIALFFLPSFFFAQTGKTNVFIDSTQFKVHVKDSMIIDGLQQNNNMGELKIVTMDRFNKLFTSNIPVGSIPAPANLLSVTMAGNNTYRNLLFDTSVNRLGDQQGIEKNWFTFMPLDKSEGSAPFFMGMSANGGGAGTNHVWYSGWNLLPGGGVYQIGLPAIGEGWEQRWRPDMWTDYTEKHEVYGRPSGSLVRLSSYTLDNKTGLIQFYHTVNRFGLRSSEYSTNDYLQFYGDADKKRGFSAFTLINREGTFNIYHQLRENSNAELTLINTSIQNDSNTVQLTGYPNLNINDKVLINSYKTGATMAFTDSNTSVTATIAADHRGIAFTNYNTKPITFETGGTQSIRINPSQVNLFTPVTIGSNTSTVGLLSVSNPNTNITGYFENTYPGNNSPHYGVLATALNGMSGVGVYATASGNTSSNIGLFADAAAGPGNYSVYAPNSAPSFFSASVGVGTLTVNTSAAFEIQSSTKGFLAPRMTKDQRDHIVNPAIGLQIYQIDFTPGLRSFNGVNWERYATIID